MLQEVEFYKNNARFLRTKLNFINMKIMEILPIRVLVQTTHFRTILVLLRLDSYEKHKKRVAHVGMKKRHNVEALPR